MARFRGSKGDMTLAGNSLANIQDWEINPSRPWMEGTSMGDAAQVGDLDIPGGTGRARCLLDYGDTAQAAVIDALTSNADTAPIAAVFVCSSSGPKQLACNILPTEGRIAAQKGQFITMDLSFRTDGAITPSWT